MVLRSDDYDAVAYPGVAYPDTHPDRLAVMARLHGLEPAPVDRCRVLDIGCNDAANIIPMAYAMPGSHFVGFDRAALPVQRAQRRIEALGLKNVRVFQADLLEVGAELGSFDYIIAHGVYAWVPEPVRDRLLAVCRQHLAPNGIAFVSYNALPGGLVRNLAAEILLQGAAMQGGAEVAADANFQAGLQLLDIVTAARPAGDPLRLLLEGEARQLRRRGFQVVSHDEMGAAQRPVSYSTFVNHAGRNGLQPVAESVLPPPNDPCYQPQSAGTARALAKGDPVAEEQVLDLMRMRSYRETLLCHGALAVDRELSLDALDGLRLASQAECLEVEGAKGQVFVLPGGLRMESRQPETILLMQYLMDAWPESVPVREVAALLERQGVLFDAEARTLILRLYVARIVELHDWAAPVSRKLAERPRASAISRQEAGAQSTVATLLHGSLRLTDPAVRSLLLLLDGTRDRAALLRALSDAHPDMPQTGMAAGLEATLRLLHRSGVLLADDFG